MKKYNFINFFKRTWKEAIIIFLALEALMFLLHYLTSFCNFISLYIKCVYVAPGICILLWLLSAALANLDHNN